MSYVDVKNTRKIYNDIWEYHKKYMSVQNDEKFLKSMISEKDILTQKYSGNTFATELIFVVFKALIADWKDKFTPPE